MGVPFQDAKLYCSEDYVNVNINNTLCVTALQAIKEVIRITTSGFADECRA
jgi:hypothetical protein